MQAQRKQAVQAEVSYWQHAVRKAEETFPDIYRQLEQAMLASGQRSITAGLVIQTLLAHHAATFLTLEQARALHRQELNRQEFFRLADTDRFNESVEQLLVFANWRLTQQVVAFDPDLGRELGWWPDSDMALDDDDRNPLPVEHLGRLPFLSFVAVPGIDDLQDERSLLRSFLVFMFEPRDTAGLYPGAAPEAVSIVVQTHARFNDEDGTTQDSVLKQTLYAAEPGMSMVDVISRGDAQPLQPGESPVTAVVLRAALPYLLYLCAENRDVDGAIAPAPKTTRTKRGDRIFPAETPSILEAGIRVGAALRQYHATSGRDNGDETEGAAGTGRSVRPHLRRSHWHLYYRGKRNVPEQREAFLRFLLPVAVNMEAGPIAPTVRPVNK